MANEINVAKNGPLLLQGPVTINKPDGTSETFEEGKTCALCRCGKSAGKPFCDGSHGRDGFNPDGD